jgi:hypothetical protein
VAAELSLANQEVYLISRTDLRILGAKDGALRFIYLHRE